MTDMTLATEGRCIDCGSPTGGLRCRPCNGQEQSRLALRETEAADRELLHLVDVEGLKGTRLAVRLGISKSRAYLKIAEAREREARRLAVVSSGESL
jgi:predicted DNA-binding protein (UPF0251 family)